LNGWLSGKIKARAGSSNDALARDQTTAPCCCRKRVARAARCAGWRQAQAPEPSSNEIAELRHRDASKRERRRVVTQGHPVQGAEGITRRERTRRFIHLSTDYVFNGHHKRPYNEAAVISESI
jgi:hypothetical protein